MRNPSTAVNISRNREAVTREYSMKRSAALFALISLLAVNGACIHEKEDPWKGYDPSVLERAWRKGDSSEIERWIVSLSDSTISDGEFFSRVAYLSSLTGFCYGNADPSEESFNEIPWSKRQHMRRHVAGVYQLYRQSCLFMKETSWEETLPLQDKYWSDSTELTSEELKQIRRAIDSICHK